MKSGSYFLVTSFAFARPILLISAFVIVFFQPVLAQRSAQDIAWLKNKMKVVEEQSSSDSAIRLIEAALQEAKSLKDDWNCNNCLLKMSEKYQYLGNFSRALECCIEATAYSKFLSVDEQCNVFLHIGRIYYDWGDYLAAAENYYTALGILKRYNVVSPNQAGVCRDLGCLFHKLHEDEKALSYFEAGEAVARDHHLYNYLALILCAKGAYYNSLDKSDSATHCYTEARAVSTAIGRPDICAEATIGLGQALMHSGDYHTAIDYFRIVINNSAVKDEFSRMFASICLGKALFKTERIMDAQRILLAVLSEPAVGKMKENKLQGYTILAEIAKQNGEYRKALEYTDSIQVLKEALVNAENTKAISLLDVKFRTAEKDRQIAMQQDKIVRKNMWILSVSTGTALLVLVLTGSVLYTTARHRSAQRENKIRILNATIEGGDHERSRIARELHDGIGGMLSAAMMRFSSLRRDNPDIASSKAYTDTLEILHGMGGEIRETAHNLMPDVVLKQSLQDAVRAYCNAVKHNGNVSIDFQCYGVSDELDQQVKLNTYRIVQELLKNALLHAHAANIYVQLLQVTDKLIVTVEDNGVGFDAQGLRKGVGLGNVQTRSETIGAQFIFESAPGKGTAAVIEVPLPQVRKTKTVNIDMNVVSV